MVIFDFIIAVRYYRMAMIESFADKHTQRLFAREALHKKLPANLQKAARKKLIMLNQARQLNDLKIPPNNRLEKLKGNRKNQYSIRINDKWRICFRWESGYASNVEIVDYH